MKVSVIGAGYLGATHAICMASLGNEVIAIDSDLERVEQLSSGRLPFFEPGLEALLAQTLESGQLTFASDLNAVAAAQIHFLCIGTPQKQESLAADLGALNLAFTSLLKVAANGSVIVGKSTVPIGTAEHLAEQLHSQNSDLDLVWNPEFLREGHAVNDTLKPNRIVIGGTSLAAIEKLKEFYKPISTNTPVFITNFSTAELVKVAANSFLATKISFINAMSEVADATGADISLLADAIGADERIGRKFLGAGIGFGGGCLPKDIRAFIARGEELGLADSLAFLLEFDKINKRARSRAVALALEELGSAAGELSGKKIGILGASFKPDSDDVRDSPALEIAQTLHLLGAQVRVHDPKAIKSAKEKSPELTFVNLIDECLDGADLVMHLTEWQEYQELDPRKIREVVKIPTIIDGRNILNRELWQSAGWKLLALGRPL